MELKDTVDLMTSDDYKDRFKAEYYQTKIRYKKLNKMLVKYRANTLDFELTNYWILEEQKSCMNKYLHALEVRAELEGIVLEG